MAVPVAYIPRESIELVRLTVTTGRQPDGQPDPTTDTTDYQLSVAAIGARPTTWVAPDQAGNSHGYLTGTLEPGLWNLWVKINGNPEHPVQEPVTIEIT